MDRKVINEEDTIPGNLWDSKENLGVNAVLRCQGWSGWSGWRYEGMMSLKRKK
jgi:hypothetical protein